MTYFDYNATKPVSPKVLEAVSAAIRDFGNPSSIYSEGRAARKRVEEAREQVAALIGASPHNVVFTSGATEANNQALLSCDRSLILTSAIEHPSVLEAVPDARLIPVSANGVLDLGILCEQLKGNGRFTLVSVMAANNEIGVIQPVKFVAEHAHGEGALFHCDAVQAVGRIPFNMQDIEADMVTISSHKLGGPQGVGALIVREGVEILSFIRGGGQERRRRGGTENVPGIVGFGLAAEEAAQNITMMRKVESLIGVLESRAKSAAPDVVIFGAEEPRIGNTSLIALPGVNAETQIMALDLAGISVSAGSACSSGKIGESHVLRAMGVEETLGRCAIRISLGFDNTLEEIENFIEIWSALRRKAA